MAKPLITRYDYTDNVIEPWEDGTFIKVSDLTDALRQAIIAVSKSDLRVTCRYELEEHVDEWLPEILLELFGAERRA